MKLAIPMCDQRIAPRFAFSREVLIVAINQAKETGREKLDISHFYPQQLPRIIALKGVTLLICGGLTDYLAEMCRLHHIEVILGVMGEVDAAIAAYLKGDLISGTNICPAGGRHSRYRRRRGRRIK